MGCVIPKPSLSILLLILFNVGTLLALDAKTNEYNVKKSNVERGCMPLNECDYYRMLLSNNIAGLSKEAIRNEIEEHTCKLPEGNPTGNRMACRSKYFSFSSR